jgi:hypothetical protein
MPPYIWLSPTLPPAFPPPLPRHFCAAHRLASPGRVFAGLPESLLRAGAALAEVA